MLDRRRTANLCTVRTWTPLRRVDTRRIPLIDLGAACILRRHVEPFQPQAVNTRLHLLKRIRLRQIWNDRSVQGVHARLCDECWDIAVSVAAEAGWTETLARADETQHFARRRGLVA